MRHAVYMKYFAVHDKILIKELLQTEDTILTYEVEGSPDKIIRGEVVSAGQKVKTVHQKMVVHFMTRHARSINLDNEQHWVVEEDKIMVAELGK